MKTKILLAGGISIIFLAVAGALLINQNKPMTKSPAVPELHFTTSVTLGGSKLNVVVANDDATRQQGLSGQRNLTEEQGMLFDFKNSERTVPGFWMKEMFISLDMIWIRDGVVIDITRDVPTPDPKTSLDDLPRYFPSEPIDTIIEVPAGWSTRHNVSIGSKLEL